MWYALVLVLLTFSNASLAQNSRPQLTWSGYITGSATLYIQGKQTDVQGRDTGAVDRPRAQFFAPLPASRTQVEVNVRRGRGRVEVVEQPVPENEYSAVVQINPSGRQPELYRLDFYWETPKQRSWWRRDDNRQERTEQEAGQTRSRSVEAGSGELRWSGQVDDEVMIEVSGPRASSHAMQGQAVLNERINLSTPMPQSANVRLEDVRGRGQVELLQQPSRENGYSAVVSIRDGEPGRAPYSFRVVWDSTASGNSTSADCPGDRGVLAPSTDAEFRSRTDDPGIARWSGRIDGRVRVTLQGNRATVNTVSGRAVSDMKVDFNGGPGIPYRQVLDVQVRKLQGRGEVRIVQLPDVRNPSLVFDVDDNGDGADLYEVEITWR